MYQIVFFSKFKCAGTYIYKIYRGTLTGKLTPSNMVLLELSLYFMEGQ
jgi:hypothetical protein